MRKPQGRFVLATGAVFGLTLLALAVTGGFAGVVNSPHDFSLSTGLSTRSSAIGPGGVCSPCHIPHNALDNVLWARNLSGANNYRTLLTLDGTPTGELNYVPGNTMQCYDCHDYHSGGGIDDVPAINLFAASHKPQNVAFGFQTQKRDASVTLDSGSTMKSDPPVGTYSGYYENAPPFTSNYGADPSLASRTDNTALSRTGGHYFKTTDPNSSERVYKGDKLPCSDCHDPHRWTNNWQAFFAPRIMTTNASQWSSVFGSVPSSSVVRASTYMANPPQSGTVTRNDADSRRMCVLCHGTSTDSVSPGPVGPVTFNQINPTKYSSSASIIRPSTGIGEHQTSSAVSCVSCHQHNMIDASCSMCHGFPPSSTSANATRYPTSFTPTDGSLGVNDSHAKHYGGRQGETRNTLPGYVYKFDCRVCHYGSAMGADSTLAQHQNNRVSVVIQGTLTKAPNGGGGAWDNTNYFNWSFAINSGVNTGQLDNTLVSGGWGVAAPLRRGGNDCRNVQCHSAGRDQAAMTADNLADYPRPRWFSGQQHCNDCHGYGNTDNVNNPGMPSYANGGSGATRAANGRANSHAKHVVGTNIECSVCHAGTVTGVGGSRAIRSTVPTLHVNQTQNVQFDGVRAQGGATPYTATNKSCQVSCHGASAPLWGATLVTSCTTCHTSQGGGTGTAGFTGPHAAHTDNSASGRYRFACEQCHALRATGGAAANTLHASGDDNTAGPAYAQVRFTDNAGTAWSYGGSPNLFETVNTRLNPFLAAAVTPAYLASASAGTGSPDPLNTSLTWSQGTCSNVWCHSNANPASAGGTANAYRTPGWNGTLTCGGCHVPLDTGTVMFNGTDRMSLGHAVHVATDGPSYTCDECHAFTVAPDSKTTILDNTGYNFHVNGNKREIRGALTVKNSSIVNTSLTYDNASMSCAGANNYCHSNGQRQTAPFVARNPAITLSWNAYVGARCGSNPCHANNTGTASAEFAAAADNTAHLAHAYACRTCHNNTNTLGLHVNGLKDILIDNTAGAFFDNDTNPANNFTAATKTCVGIACHGGRSVAWTDNIASCDACHTTTNGVAVTVNRYNFTYQNTTVDMSKVSPTLFSTRGHGLNGTLPWTGGTNPGSLFGRAMVCNDCHDMSVAHGVTTNPFRFRATVNSRPVTFDNVDTLCYACHTSAAVKRHASGVTGGGTRLFAHNQRCVDCHDVHGQNNIFMVYDNLVTRDNAAPNYETSDGYGRPYFPSDRRTVVFTANTAGINYAGSGSNNGICEVCHLRTIYYNAIGTGLSHPSAVCTSCHKHEEGFKGGGCKGCHGPDSVVAGAPDVGAYWATRGHGSPAITTLMGRVIECEDCHDVGYLSGADHKTNVAGTPPTNINSYNYPGKTINADTQPNANTAHLKSNFINTGAANRADIARTFDNYCMNASCHRTLQQHRHVNPPNDVMRFGDNNTAVNPKLNNWFTFSSFPSSYPSDFYRTLSPWIDSDIRVSGLGDTNNYGLCISCHDPHGTPVTDNTHTGNATLGFTNHMLRGNWVSDPDGFCNRACH